MAKQTLNYAFKDCQISLADNLISEFKKGELVGTYVLSDILKKFEGEDKLVNFTINEASELEPVEVIGLDEDESED